ncbi:MAG TPA: hypothetical protein VNW52_00210 [Burkholderiaceae bacterium]|jgi:hypothetical protein|nr:hypothetical protein [Burkholderiaceae bacterium]
MKNSNTPQCVVLYRWKLKPGLEQQFIESWSQGTADLLLHGSFGSRLHKGSDGIWYAYAQWPSAEVRETAFANSPDTPVQEKLREAIDESFPPVFLEPVSDYLRLPI